MKGEMFNRYKLQQNTKLGRKNILMRSLKENLTPLYDKLYRNE